MPDVRYYLAQTDDEEAAQFQHALDSRRAEWEARVAGRQ